VVDREREGRGSLPGQCPELSRKGITRIGGVAGWFEVMARPDRVGHREMVLS
jgi:hypothetical protein